MTEYTICGRELWTCFGHADAHWKRHGKEAAEQRQWCEEGEHGQTNR